MFGFDIAARREHRLTADIGGPVRSGRVVDYATEGLLAGTTIATATGWRPVEAISAGDQVLTFDNGLQTVIAVSRAPMPARLPAFARPVLVPAGALGNSADMILLPDQNVMVESDAAERLFADPFAILRARDLVGLRGIEAISGEALADVITLHFDAHEVIHAGGGALVLADADVPGAMTLELLSSTRLPAPYSSYSGQAARMIVSAMLDEDARLGEGWPARPTA